MLVLTRNINQSIIINKDVEVKILGIDRGQIKIGIDAPKEVVILRKELVGKARNK